MNITNLCKDYKKTENEYYPVTWFHGINYPFTYSCGYCSMPVKEHEKICRFCNKTIVWKEGKKE